MRERFDFSTVSLIILDNRKRSAFTQAKYYETILSYAFTQENVDVSTLDEGNASKYVNGQRRIPRYILRIYRSDEGFNKLRNDVSKVLDEIFDINNVIVQIRDLIQEDNTLNQKKKVQLLEAQKDSTTFLTACIMEGLERDYIERQKETYLPQKKFELSDYLYDYHLPAVNKVFKGRDKEIEGIHKRLKTESCLFLQGIGGIGKSELAKRYGRHFKTEYDNILYLNYEESLHQTICALDFIDDTQGMSEEERFKLHYQLFKNMDENSLVILDNFDTAPEKDDLFFEFISLSFRLLATTRGNLEEVSCYQVKEIESLEALEEIFYTYAPRGRNKPEIVREIIESVYRHTFTVEMDARTMTSASLEPEELLGALETDGLYLSTPNKIRIQKDAKAQKECLSHHIQRLFQLQELSGTKQFILYHMPLLPNSGIPKSMFRKLLGAEDFNDVNTLIDYGWIQRDNEKNCISMHPYLQDVLTGMFPPSVTKCGVFLKNLGNEYTQDIFEGDYYYLLLNMVQSVFRVIKIDDSTITFELMNKMLIYLESYNYHVTMEWLLDVMEKMIPLEEDHPRETIIYELYRGNLATHKGDHFIAETHYDKCIHLIQPIDESNAKLAIKLYSMLGEHYFRSNNMEQFQKYQKATVELYEKYDDSLSLDACSEHSKLLMAAALNGDIEEVAGILFSGTDEDMKEGKVSMSPFMEKTREMINASMSMDEYKNMLQQFNFAETELPDELRIAYQNVTEDMKEYTSSEQDSFAMLELVNKTISSVIEHIPK